MSETTLTAPNDTALTQLGLGAFLRRHHGRSLVLVAQDLAHWYVGEVAASANQVAIANGYHLISLDFHRSAARERALLTALCEADIGGAIFLWDHSPDNLDLYERLTANCPCVQVIDPKPIAGLDFVGVDEYSGGMFAVRHLIHLGYRQIGHVTMDSSLQSLHERKQAYYDALHQAGLPVREEWVLDLPYGLIDADRIRRRPAIRQFLERPQRPRALFVCADWVASELVECAYELGLSIPEDMAIVGYDDAPPYALTGVPLTTVRIDLQQIGRLAMERLLLRMRDGVQTEAVRILIPPMLVVRESSARMTATTERWAFVVRYIQDHFRHDITALEVAGVVGLEPHYFSNQFRRVFGRRFTDHIHQLRLQYATQLLVTTDHTVAYIAKDAGFQSSNHFYAIFKRNYHSSPLAYRKQYTVP